VGRSSRLPAEVLQAYLIDLPHPRSPHWRVASQQPHLLDWRVLFGNDHPIEIEVGFGKGMFLVNSSGARPGVSFLGIEIERKYVHFTAARLAKRGATNVRLACTDARWLLKECLPAESVQAVHVYFPDPWWKQRHQKRKLFTAEFAVQCARVLTPGGALHFVTDVAEYFEETCAMLAQQHLLRRVDEANEKEAMEGFLTNFERKYRAEGRAIYRARFQR
jgi:tRNA (guanine-N7-)-methyltransferase